MTHLPRDINGGAACNPTRNMKKVIKILLVALICMATSCPDKENENCHTAIWFSNNSEKSLRVVDMFTDIFFRYC